MIKYTLDASGLNLRLKAIDEKLKNTKSLMDKIGDYMVGSIRQNIEEGGRSNRYAQNIWGTTPLLKTGHSYFAVQKNEVSDSHVVVSSAGGKAAYSHDAHTQIVTPRMRKYFWWKYSQTKQQQWLAMAVSPKGEFVKLKRRYMMFQEPKDTEAIVQMVKEHILGK